MDNSISQQPEYVEEPCAYLFTATLSNAERRGQVAVNIDRDSDFMLTGIHGSSDGDYTLNFRLPSGRLWGNAEVPNSDVIGTANQPTAIGPPPIYRAGSVGPQLNLTNLETSNNTVVIVFDGIRRIRTT